MSSDNLLSFGTRSTARGLVDRVKGFFQHKDRVDEGGLRLLLDQDREETGPLALYSPTPSTVELGAVHAEHGGRWNSKVSYCLSVVWFNRKRIWVIIGVLSLLFVASVSIKVFFWDRNTLPLQNAPALPEYSTSLGCLDAHYKSEPITLKGPIFSDGRHTVVITGGVVGTLSILGTGDNATEVVYEMKLATDDGDLLRGIRYELTSSEETSTMHMGSLAFSPPDAFCHQRFDITVRIPPTVRHLDITTEGTTHVLFNSKVARLPKLDSLTVDLRSPDHKNMILTNLGVRADTLSFAMGGGLLSGNMPLVQNMTLRQSGYASMLVDAVSANDASLASVATVLRTESGVGRSLITYRHFSGAAHRQIDSMHKSAGGYLNIDYGTSGFEGSVEVTAGRVSANGALRGAVTDGARVKNKKMWVGRQEGTDRVMVESPRGYAALLF